MEFLERRFLYSPIGPLDPRLAPAYALHKSLAGASPFLWVRPEEKIREFAEAGCFFAAMDMDSGDVIGVCYAREEKKEGWEIGGISVVESARKFSVASTLFRLAIARVFTYVDPWVSGRPVIAHVHAQNQDPRPLIEKALKFTKHPEQLRAHEDDLPDDMPMRLTPDGFLVGDVFCFTRDSLEGLVTWFHELKPANGGAECTRTETKEVEGKPHRIIHRMTLARGDQLDDENPVSALDAACTDLRELLEGVDSGEIVVPPYVLPG